MAEPLGFDPLSELRDLALPQAVSWWPPAPGWWIVAAVAVTATFFAVQAVRRTMRSPQRAGRRELEVIEKQFFASGNAEACLVAISTLLRRVALARHEHTEVAGLTGERWLEFLDSTGATNEFTRAQATALTAAPYQKQCDVRPEALFPIVRRWIDHQSKPKGAS